MKTEIAQTPQAAQQEIPGQEAKASRKKNQTARQANAEKQRRYRASMKAQGYKAKLIWERPLEAGWSKVSTAIRESSLSIGEVNPALQEIMERLFGMFIYECNQRGIPEKVWRPAYQDFLTLLKPLTGEQRVT
jgi:hypothetical protein